MEEKYEVVYRFKDLQDNNYIYKVGEIYPREGLEPTKKRIKELSTEKNKIGKVLIRKIEEETEETENPENDEEITEELKEEETEETENDVTE
jgi:hypothetical protein